MRDIGTEMTPVPSQEPSRTGTPHGATTPSMPTTTRRGAPMRSSPDADELDSRDRSWTPELSERELQLKTRREIAALGVQLGKMSIASWASKENVEHPSPCSDDRQLAKMEKEVRAVAWEEAEKSKHIARYRREELKLQAWESHERARIEATMRRAEAKAEQARSCAKEKTAEKLATLRRRVDEKLAAAEARMSRRAVRTAVEAQGIRRTGRFPPPSNVLCYRGCLFYASAGI